ncbi:MAG: DUF4339 domain-containing protein [Candidatus Brocadiia bacterium]
MPEENKVWFVGVKGERKGPFTTEEVNGMIAEGQVTPRDVIWKEGQEDWKPVAELEEFAEAVKAAPPPPPAAAAGPTPVGEYFNSLWTDLRSVGADPDQGLGAVAEKRSPCFALTWIVLGVLVFSFLSLQRSMPIVLQAGETSVKTFQLVGPDAYETDRMRQPESRGTLFLKGLLHGVIVYGIFFGILMLATVPILKSQANWQDALTVLGVASIPTVIIGLLTFALVWIHPFLMILITLAVVASMLFFYEALLRTSKLSKRATLYAVPVVYFVSLLLYALLRLAMA